MIRVLTLAGATIELHDSGLTVTKFPQGVVRAVPHDDAEYRDRAAALGYGSDTLAMSREHEVVHHVLAAALDLPHSPTLMGVATGRFWEHWQVEESAVLGIQKFCRMAGADVLSVAANASRRD